MTKKGFLLFAIYVGAQSFVLQLIDKLLSPYLTINDNKGFVFIAFQGWALYFLLGSVKKGIVQGLVGYVAGIVFSLTMILFGNIISFMKILTVPMVALLIVPVMMCFEYGPWWINNVAIFFIGSGAFYGVYNYVPEVGIWGAIKIVIMYCLLGLFSGYGTVWFRKLFEIETRR